MNTTEFITTTGEEDYTIIWFNYYVVAVTELFIEIHNSINNDMRIVSNVDSDTLDKELNKLGFDGINYTMRTEIA